jgi:hypothetical protein
VSGPAAAGWRLVGIVHNSDRGLPAGALVNAATGVQDQILSPFYENIPGYGYRATTRLVRGRGYFVKTSQGAMLQSEGTLSSEPSITLQGEAGWQLMANPLAGAIDWSVVTKQSVLGSAIRVGPNGTYEPLDGKVLQRFEGFWVKFDVTGGGLLFPNPYLPSGNAALSVSPPFGLSFAGPVGGPFSPTTGLFRIGNIGSASMTWSVEFDRDWVPYSLPLTMSLSPGSYATIPVNDRKPDHLQIYATCTTAPCNNTTWSALAQKEKFYGVMYAEDGQLEVRRASEMGTSYEAEYFGAVVAGRRMYMLGEDRDQYDAFGNPTPDGVTESYAIKLHYDTGLRDLMLDGTNRRGWYAVRTGSWSIK